MRRGLLALALISIPTAPIATTAPDLSGRIVIDGAVGEYADDEWVLDTSSPRPERPDDSLWGSDNDVGRVAVTWDDSLLYVAIEGVTFDSGLMAWIEHAAGGITRLDGLGEFRRQISFDNFFPNYLIWANPGEVVVARVNAAEPLQRRGDWVIPRAFSRDAAGRGALEMAIPWSEITPTAGVIRMITAISARTGTGTGDAAPDPSVTLSSSRTAAATLDQVLMIIVDGDGDGQPDMGVSPRAGATVEPGGVVAARTDTGIEVRPDTKTLAPDLSETVRFSLVNSSSDAIRLFVTCRVYSVDGRLMRELYGDTERTLAPGVNLPGPLDEWDGTDSSGAIVAGGVYILNLVWGEAGGAKDGSFNASVAVVR